LVCVISFLCGAGECTLWRLMRHKEDAHKT
jgi:hypothetical protein